MSETNYRTNPLDRFDRAILDILRRDNRTPQRTIAERVNLSPAAVQRRIAAMEANGTIIANVAIVSPTLEGPRIAIVVEVHLVNDRSELVEPIKALFRQTVEVQQCYYVTGNGGFVLIVSVPDMASYEVLARSLFADNDAVSTYRTLVVLDAVKAPAAP
ncbi:MAG: Lrp/AsnC family transcriptional regulator [Cereibacter sphaeroides]|jgi:DNA-binding Lrp family transcriptional regulator|uniref:Lrp/AsnC family transcriptional regulator n=2 Tax=Alphaproteobacteria TaxID=28211 RepID=A0A2W5RY29_CERSP|nr:MULTISPECIES: Lrp/AsnC family transcriptional regulator [Sphingomonas]MBN2974029.1 Lrp/AsnC family transcriptional regulator [Roseomonas aeriglobus]PZQ94219.1 MAG: Lrp/AsnC family transcriptional regulator [Cereibacter sphaeroides]KQO56301.1 AsnC family transcriptional regulator [Sphingomonas sp. Leaf257]MDX5986465.1 Lrp/AsnC family transcriptional regulator [Sphingomonas echinoides]OMJ30610.1 AsnC family transcriptional regulator [Sphingomonas sp. Sph1(2015)]